MTVIYEVRAADGTVRRYRTRAEAEAAMKRDGGTRLRMVPSRR